MKTMPAAQFKARCLRIMDEVQRSREPVVVTKKGVPVAKLVPAEGTARDVFGCMIGTAEIRGDIESPVLPLKAWRAAR